MQPEVLEGYRGPRHEQRFTGRPNPGFTGVPAGKRMFQFTKGRYRVQLTAPRAIHLPDGRVQEGDKPLVVQAEDYFKILDVVKDAKVIEMLEQHKDYGTDFWDFQDTLRRQKEEKFAQAIKVLDDPELRERIIEALKASGEDDFPLPAAPKRDSAVQPGA